jgi:Domain of unknown function (DUF1816)
MVESTLIVNIALLMLAAIGLIILTQAAVHAWQGRVLYADHSQRTWGWWIELHTGRPECLYYFGPFSSAPEAEDSVQGYIQDLSEEGAENITVQVKLCRPRQLTSPSPQSSEIALGQTLLDFSRLNDLTKSLQGLS